MSDTAPQPPPNKPICVQIMEAEEKLLAEQAARIAALEAELAEAKKYIEQLEKTDL